MSMDKQHARFAQLLREMGEEVKEDLRRERAGKTWGWQRALGQRLGLDRAIVSRVLSGLKTRVSDDSIAQVIEKARLKSEYFYGPVEPKTYHDYLRGKYEAWHEFLRTPMARSALKKYPQHMHDLENMTFSSPPTVHLYQSLLIGMIGSAAQAEAMLVTTGAVLSQLEADRVARPLQKREKTDEEDHGDE